MAATLITLVVAFADFIADQGTGGCATNGAQRSIKDSIANHAASDCADTGTDLGVAWVAGSACQREADYRNCSQDVGTNFHGNLLKHS